MLTLLVILAVAAILFLAAVVATQDTALLADAAPDGADVELPAGRVVAEDLRAVRFGLALRGYRMSEVDDVLDRLGEELADRDERIADLERVLAEIVEPVVDEVEARPASPEPVEDDAVDAPRAVLDDEPPLAAEIEAEHHVPSPAASFTLPTSDATSFRLPLVAEEPAAPEVSAPEPETAPELPAPASSGEDERDVSERAMNLASAWRLSSPVGAALRRPSDAEPEPAEPPAEDALGAAEEQVEPDPAHEPSATTPVAVEAAPSAVPEQDDFAFPEVLAAEGADPTAPEAVEAQDEERDASVWRPQPLRPDSDSDDEERQPEPPQPA